MKSNNELAFQNQSNSKNSSREELCFWILFAAVAVYYGFRLFALTPWYDELYTYYCFISKGPVYAAIHWPLPNNHVGYSVLSACLNQFGNSYIGLRGVSYLAALWNMWLLFRIGKRHFTDWISLGTTILYISMNLVNQLAVQGRGYTLGISCFLCALLCVEHICEESSTAKKYYILFVLSLVLGLYTVSSNVYWVVPLCMAGGSYLLYMSLTENTEKQVFFLKNRYGGKLVRLVAAAFAGAVSTIGLYTTIWLAIGSNLLVKDSESIYFGMGHVQMIIKAPFKAIARGADYMLATPYIQSEERAGFTARLAGFFVSLSGQLLTGLEWGIIGIWLVGIVFLCICLWRNLKNRNNQMGFLQLLLLIATAFIPLCLLIQCKRPYFRVFTYTGVLLALLVGTMLNALCIRLREKQSSVGRKINMNVIVTALLFAFGIKCIFFSGYNEQYSTKEHQIQDAIVQGVNIYTGEIGAKEVPEIYVTDCNQQYLMYFLYGVRCENQELEGSELLLLDKRMTDPEFNEMVWEFYQYYDTLPWDYINGSMEEIYNNDGYIVYQKNK